MGIERRTFLKGALAMTGSLAAGVPLVGCDGAPPFVEAGAWDAGDVAHLLPTANDHRIRLKASLRTSSTPPPRLRVGSRVFEGRATDAADRFFVFDAAGLEPATTYELQLETPTGAPLCDPWPLRTFPPPDATPERFRLLSYTCAGGSDLFRHPLEGRIFQPTPVRQRLLARALSFAPDAAIANGDHVYWDILSRPGIGMGRSPQAWWSAGFFDREQGVIGTGNEEILKDAFGPQIAGLYGTLFRSLPLFFLQDDHDYTENDEATAELRTFPADTFMRAVARATQRLYYPELLPAPGVPAWLQTNESVSESFGGLRYGRLFEAWLYDCRRALANSEDPDAPAARAHFVPPEVEAWLLDRTANGDTLHAAHVPSTPVLWTAGKWGEWYPDVTDTAGALSIEVPKPYWPRGWLEQHDRLLAQAAARQDRTPLWVSGDLHATGAGTIVRSGELSFETNPVVSLLSGTPGTAGPGWPSRFRGQRPTPSRALEAEEWVAPVEENGFSLLDFTPDGVRISQFRWNESQGIDAIAKLEPFFVREIERPVPAGREGRATA